MTNEHFLVTGAMGCIGAWVVRNLIQEGVPTTVLDLAGDAHRMRLIMSADEIAQVRFVTGDIADLPTVERVLAESGATRIIHLAALQVPFCKADPSLGARVNVVGTVNVFEAAKRQGLRHMVYASSVAVYGSSEDYPEGLPSHDAPLLPRTHYGVYKQANEGTARIYWQDDGISSICLRPYTVYGPGRDQGLTSSPTKAMLAAAVGQPFHIPFGGRGDFQFVDDVAKAFIQSARTSFAGAVVLNLRGSVLHMREIIAAIEEAEPAMRGRLSCDDTTLPFPEVLDITPVAAVLGQVPQTTLADGVATTIAIFKPALADGRLTWAK
ncbi:MAG: NAD-dependent epimerase/dehydratase family protein [Chloroflexales bacterium]|nr:NAD-dependent epimerase/dehydratase family protein [Chloroflexales bacterium]